MPQQNERLAASDKRRIVISRDFDAPRVLVWHAMTDPAQVVKWWGPRGFTTTIEEMDLRPGGAWRHVMHGPDGSDYPNSCVFKEVEKPKRVVFSNGGGKQGEPGINFLSTWTFDELEPGRTRVTINMAFQRQGDYEKAVKEYGAIEGAAQTLERMAEHLRNARPAEEEFTIERVFDAPRDVVFRAWTEAERLARWFGPKGCTIRSATMDLRPGGLFHFCMLAPDGLEMWGKWIFREIVVPERIVLVSSFSDEKGGLKRHPMVANWPLETLSTTTFAELGGRTKLTLRWAPHNPTADERKAFDCGHESMRMGWSGSFEQLDAYLASRDGRS
jgi:uncharacterized protein YndB with AHSA1/START domain